MSAVNVPEMSAKQREQFDTAVARLLQARWTNGRVADWAISAESGFARFWRSRDHALEMVNVTLRGLNAAVAVQNRAIAAENRALRDAAWAAIERDPLAHLIKAVGGKSKPDPRRGRRS